MKNILKLFPYIQGFYKRIAGLTSFSLIIAALNAYRPQIYKQIVDTVSSRGTSLSWADITPYLYVLLIVSIIWVIVNYSFNVIAMKAHLSARSTLRIKVFEKLTSLNIDYFEINRPGAIMQKAGDAVNSFAGWVMSLNFSLLGPIFSIIVITVILFMNNIWLGILSLFIVGFSSFEFKRVINLNKKPNRIWRKQMEKSWAIFSETIQNMATISTLSGFKQFQHQLTQTESAAVKLGLKVRGRWQISNSIITSVNEAAYILAIIIVLAEVIHGRMTLGTFVALTAYFSTIRSDAQAFAGFIPDTDRVERDVERLIEVLEIKPTFPDNDQAVALKKLDSIEFKMVSFRYPDGKKGAIENISFRIDKDRSIALVGPSGVGKSTITKLLLRFYPPTSGEILINDQPAQTFTHESIRQHIGMVMQDVALFNTTVKENLKLASPKATTAELEDAAQQAHAADFIEDLPKQYNTIVGERGVKLSGGQKQRVAIARAILKDPDLIILDEATSALDSESESHVQAGLNKLMSGRLSLTIAHRLSTVRHADEIIVLKSGKITERGSHEQLINLQSGLYKKLFELQSATGKISL